MAAPCSDFLNNPLLNTTNAAAGVPPHPGCSALRARCTSTRHVHSPLNYTICNICRNQATRILALRQPPAMGANVNTVNYRNMSAVGPPPIAPLIGPPPLAGFQHWQTPAEFVTGIVTAPPAPNPRFDAFLTRLCRSCEQFEQSEARYRLEAMIAPVPGFAPALYHVEYEVRRDDIEDITKWDWYPYSSCTCKHALGAARNNGLQALNGQIATTNRLAYGNLNPWYCLDHRQLEFEDLVKARDRNNNWLRNIELVDPTVATNTALQRATDATRMARVQGPGRWRACRCGNEIDHFDAFNRQIHTPEVYQCLACEGTVVSILPAAMAGSVHALLPPAELEPHLLRLRKVARMRLRRTPKNAEKR